MDYSNHPPKTAKRHSTRLKESKTAGSQIDAAFLLGALKRWTLVAIPLALIFAAVGGGAVYLLYKPEYKATAILLVKRDKPYIAFQEEEDKKNDIVSNEIELLKSPLVFRSLTQPDEDDKENFAEFNKLPEIMELKDPIVELPKLIRVNNKNGSELMSVSFTGPNAENAQKIVNKVVEQYLAERAKLKKADTQAILKQLDEYRKKRTGRVEELNEIVRKFARDFANRDPFLQQLGSSNPNSLDPAADLESRVTGNSYSQKVLQKDIEQLEEEIKANPLVEKVEEPTEEEINNRIQKDAIVVAKKLELQTAEQAYETSEYYRSGLGPKHPQIAKFLANIRLKKEALDKELKEARPRIVSDLRLEAKGKIEDGRLKELEKLKKDLASLQFGENFLRQQLKDIPKREELESDDFFDYVKAREELSNKKAALEQISTRIFALETEREAPERVKLLDEASVPLTPVADVPYKTIALVGIFGLCFPFGLAVLWEIKVRRFSHTDQITDHFDTPIVAEVANLPRRALGARRLSSRLNRELRVYEESVDSLRTNLLLALRERNLQVIAVTSSISGEGKTSLATQLSISISKAIGKPTLLVDGDMRAPDIHHLFEIDSNPGLAEVLAGKCELQDAVVESSIENLDVLPAGLLSANPAYLLSNGSASKFFKQVREEYEYVILDTPPILSANESMLLADAADGTLFCVMRDTSRYAHVKNAWHRINTAGGQMVGVVFNNVPAKNYIRTYGSYDYQLD